jgi:hypothetical protein
MTVDKMIVDKMTVDKMIVDEMTVDKMTVDKMTIDKMTVDKMPCCQSYNFFFFALMLYINSFERFPASLIFAIKVKGLPLVWALRDTPLG